jgi:hypothetical protein
MNKCGGLCARYGDDGEARCFVDVEIVRDDICDGRSSVVSICVSHIEISLEDFERLARASDACSFAKSYIHGEEICSHLCHHQQECACEFELAELQAELAETEE